MKRGRWCYLFLCHPTFSKQVFIVHICFMYHLLDLLHSYQVLEKETNIFTQTWL